jgi:beta-mannosidase
MRRAVSSFLLFAILSGLSTSALARTGSVELNSGWEFRQHFEAQPAGAEAVAGTPSATPMTEWRPAEVPGSIHTDLLRQKLIPDPFFRENEAKLQWIENASWEYRKRIDATPDLLKHGNVDLVFDGLDAYALVYLNGQQILVADNMFRQWRVPLKKLLKPGANELLVVFPSVIKAAQQIAAQDKWHVPSKTDDKVYIRKAAYEYGWDWGPRFVTSGIWRPARLETWDAARISNLHIRQRDISAKVAHLVAEAEITAAQDGAGIVTVTFSDHGKKAELTRKLELLAGVNHVDIPIDIEKPELWYPTGYGAQAMYTFGATLKFGAAVEDSRSLKAGLRSVVLRRDIDQWGRSFEFLVNGIPVFAKGADVIPFDSFPTRVTTADYRKVLESAKEANMNMIRHWGGGYYETDEFYALCDELGIMVWQDFMFGNDWQPGTYPWKLNVAQEAEYQLRRLRDHPSIVLWCGNNETEEAFHWRNRDRLDADTRIHMWGDYVSTFSGVLAQAVERLTPETPYWPSSPSSDYEETSETYQSGDSHNWQIWHGAMLPIRDYEKFFPRFMSEYGFQSFPDMQTVATYTLPEDRTGIMTPLMLAHQKNTSGNSIIQDYMLRDYPEPKDFASFLYMSQVLQAEAIKIGAEHLRRIRPRSMGSLYWQLNDCWPVASWASLDYQGHWKALQYYARRFYNDVLVSPHEEDGTLAVYVVSDRTAATNGNLRVQFMTFEGKVLSDKTVSVEVAPLSSKIYWQTPLADFQNTSGEDAARMFAVTDLVVGGKVVSSNLIFFVPTKQVRLPAATIAHELTRAGNGYRLHLSSPVLARDVYVSFGDVEANVADNYFDLVPGRPVDIEIASKADLDKLSAALKIVSLADAFPPRAAATNTASGK